MWGVFSGGPSQHHLAVTLSCCVFCCLSSLRKEAAPSSDLSTRPE
jgi:hypothetical protein